MTQDFYQGSLAFRQATPHCASKMQLEDQVPLKCNSQAMHLNLTQDVQPSKEMNGGVVL
jgi:hypothetical protein